MTDKQIIIDSVDVSGCDFYDKNKKYCLTLKMNPTGFKNPSCFSGDFQKCIQDSKVCPYTFCDNNPNCYYKQLKRKEQECEELKENLPNIITRLMGELDQLKAENEDLKKQYKELGQCSKNLKDYFEKEKETLSNRFLKLKQTLAEIKEIAEDAKTKVFVDMEEFWKQILQKCEVLDE